MARITRGEIKNANKQVLTNIYEKEFTTENTAFRYEGIIILLMEIKLHYMRFHKTMEHIMSMLFIISRVMYLCL
ncbi:hypothetical protein [Helicobacter rodentium]|uniref:hypothetical protein n=1 Tax=Helicobacter rodentium TaxID=59617 RepID=UPI002354D2E5|nr:hypothetical protein [Helicobacter rodentium]